jgi:hypothetical protein
MERLSTYAADHEGGASCQNEQGYQNYEHDYAGFRHEILQKKLIDCETISKTFWKSEWKGYPPTPPTMKGAPAARTNSAAIRTTRALEVNFANIFLPPWKIEFDCDIYQFTEQRL